MKIENSDDNLETGKQHVKFEEWTKKFRKRIDNLNLDHDEAVEPVYRKVVDVAIAVNKYFEKSTQYRLYVNRLHLFEEMINILGSIKATFKANNLTIQDNKVIWLDDVESVQIEIAGQGRENLWWSLIFFLDNKYELAFTLLRNTAELARANIWIKGDEGRYNIWVEQKHKGRSPDCFDKKDTWENIGIMIYRMACILGTHSFDTTTSIKNIEEVYKREDLDEEKKKKLLYEMLQIEGRYRHSNKKYYSYIPDEYLRSQIFLELIGADKTFDYMHLWYFSYIALTFLLYRYFLDKYPDDFVPYFQEIFDPPEDMKFVYRLFGLDLLQEFRNYCNTRK